jgi:DNA-binding phage protein
MFYTNNINLFKILSIPVIILLWGVKNMENESTENLFDELRESNSIDYYISKYDAAFPEIDMISYIFKSMEAKKIKKGALIKRSQISRTYAYEIFSGHKSPSRNTTLRLAFGLALTIDETQKLLILAQQGILYPKVKRDSIIIYGLSNNYTVTVMNALLYDNNVELI